MRRGNIALVLLAITAVTLSVDARAEDEAPAAAAVDDAEAAYREGRQALVAKEPARARAAFARGLDAADAGEDRFRFLLGIALAHEMAGAPARASWFYRAFLDAAAADPAGEEAAWKERRGRVQRDLQALLDDAAESTGELSVRSTPAGARIAVDGSGCPPS